MELVVFLRGVNVGSKRFQPSLLAKEVSHLDAVNLGAAGTFGIRGVLAQSALRDEFLRRLPFSADLMICQGRDIARLVATEPFPDATLPDGWRRFVSVLARRPRTPPPLPASHPAGDRWEVRIVGLAGRFALSYWRRLGRSFVEPNGIVEKHFGVRATTRNWNTMVRLCELLGSARKAPPVRASHR